MNDRSKIVESRFLFAAMICAVLLIVNYFALVGTPWGHQFDDDAFLGRKALGVESYHVRFRSPQARQKADAFSWSSGHTRYRGYASLYHCWCHCGSCIGCAEVLKHVLPWHMLVPNDAMLESGFQTNTYPSGHATVVTSFALSLRSRRPLATVSGYRRRLHQRNLCDRCPVCRLASSI